MELNGITREDLYEITALARRHAARNPYAIWKEKSVRLDDYMTAPMVADPHCLYDCDMPVCGAAAFVIARSGDIPHGAVSAPVLSWSNHLNPEAVFKEAGLKPSDIDLCQLYDGFSTMIPEWLEAFGWCETGKSLDFIKDGKAELDGTLPLNTFGGSLGEGRLHGIGHLREAYLQVSGQADERQLSNANRCLVQIGPFDSSSFVLLGHH